MNGKNKVMFEEVDPNYIETFPELIKSLRTAVKRHTKKQYSKVPVASCNEKWSMVPLIYPDKPCEKPSIWDSIPSTYKRPKGAK